MEETPSSSATEPPRAYARLFFARHAERKGFARLARWDMEYNSEAIAAKEPHWDDVLTSEGIRQAQALAKCLPAGAVRRVISSPWRRCVQTAAVVAYELGIDVFELDASLGEFEYEQWFGANNRRPGDLTMPIEGLQDLVDVTLASLAHEHPPSVRLIQASHKLPDPRRDGEWEVDEDKRPTAVAAALLERAAAIDGTLLLSHGGVARAIVQALTSSEPGEVHYASWCEAQLPLSAAAAITSVMPMLVKNFSSPVCATASQRWADGQMANWRRWFGPEEAGLGLDGRPVRVLELGSWEGLSLSFWLQHILSRHPDSLIVCVDHFDDMETDAGAARRQRLLANARLFPLPNKLRVLPNFTLPALMQVLHDHGRGSSAADDGFTPLAGDGFDLVYVDADHTARGTLLDALLAWKLLRTGGHMLFDDYMWPVQSEHHPYNPPSVDHPDHPQTGIDAFLKLAGHELEIVSKDYQLLVRKTCPGPEVGFPAVGGKVLPVAVVLDNETELHVVAGLLELAAAAGVAGRVMEVLVLAEANRDGSPRDRGALEATLSDIRLIWASLNMQGVPFQGAARRVHMALNIGQVCPGRYDHVLMLVPEAARPNGWARLAVELWKRRPLEPCLAISSAVPAAAIVRPHSTAWLTPELTLRQEVIPSESDDGWINMLQRTLPAEQCQSLELGAE